MQVNLLEKFVGKPEKTQFRTEQLDTQREAEGTDFGARLNDEAPCTQRHLSIQFNQFESNAQRSNSVGPSSKLLKIESDKNFKAKNTISSTNYSQLNTKIIDLP